MKVISLIQRKGGSAKTSTAVNLAASLLELHPDLRISIADADPQGSAFNWVNRSKGAIGISVHKVAADGEGRGLKLEIDEIGKNAGLVIIDTPPSLSSVSLRAALRADLMLIPSSASILDLQSCREAIQTCEEAIEYDPRKKFLLIPSRIQLNTSAGQQLRGSLENWGPVSRATIALRVAYSEAAIVGLGVTQYAPESNAAAEMRLLAEEVSELLGFSEVL
jgi:chromosome partitioning protein